MKGKKAQTVVVAVIDMGIDTTHEDLSSVLWTNAKEVQGNGIDDDQNGYIDDSHGWNFTDSGNSTEDLALIAMHEKKFFDSLSHNAVPEAFRASYRANRKALKDCNAEKDKMIAMLDDIRMNALILDRIVRIIGKKQPQVDDFNDYKTTDELEKRICNLVIRFLPYYTSFEEYRKKNVEIPIEILSYQIEHGIDSDDSLQGIYFEDRNQGDKDVTGPFLLLSESEAGSYHATSIAGVIAANRINNIGIKGVANQVKVMSLRVISFFDGLHDNDVAAAIRYAVDNGARVINMSFGRSYSLNKMNIDGAVKYAMSKDVLIIKSAGNEGMDVDKEISYPNKKYADNNGEAGAWIVVGASGWKNDSSLLTPFSNYGRVSVDVFAPGVHIFSCDPGSRYRNASGTSIAAPMVAGLAALIMEYYPKLTAIQVKDIIMKSVVKRDILKDKCVSGGVVNAYNALKLAATYK